MTRSSMTRSSTPRHAAPQAATLSTHVLDAGSGRPAVGVPLTLLRRAAAGWESVGQGVTDDDGRCAALAPDGLHTGVWQLVFDTSAYFAATGVRGFYPEVGVVFEVTEPTDTTTSRCCCPLSPTPPTEGAEPWP